MVARAASFDNFTTTRRDIQPGRLMTAWVEDGVIRQIKPTAKAHAKPVTVIVSGAQRLNGDMVVTGTLARNDGTPRKGGATVQVVLTPDVSVFVKWNNCPETAECAEAPAE